jgi:putative aldouronate transport system permease protein
VQTVKNRVRFKKSASEDGYIRSSSDRIFDGFVYLILSFILLIVLYPLVYVVSSSLSNPMDILLGKVVLWPVHFTFTSYTKVFQENRLTLGYLNTIKYTFVGTSINLVLTTTGSYVLSRENLRGRKFFTAMILFTMLFSGGLIPTYLVVYKLNLVNTIWSVTLPNAIGVTNFIIMKSFFRSACPKRSWKRLMSKVVPISVFSCGSFCRCQRRLSLS